MDISLQLKIMKIMRLFINMERMEKGKRLFIQVAAKLIMNMMN